MYDLRDLTIRSISVSEMDNNVYLLTAKTSGAQVLIDAADDAAAILALLAEGARDTSSTAKPTLLITTHSHWDHVRALAEIVEATGMKTAAGTADVEAIAVPTDVPLDHGDVGNFEGFDLEAISLRGHTPGSTALLYRDPAGPPHLFTGDSLFPGGVGNTGGDPARFDSLYTDVVERVFDVLPDETVVHPGHGKSTTLGAERPALNDWRSRGW
ncbi:glyoxylase-like metal-dependent hydrolase (beta-lactamase superfamily II) [Arthrobacter pigmenti]|uniref:Glyoxylase-like metal-dependent hydrolase (Beta-lactamase superfamily II) n=1 Tax=Arthrobacter pigmenti TaxID=271432 RepID=A0A846RKT6_9MICC|nr:MBL fold metallo-hydrolase [Arthrobacter pigmenti]NJC22290.1 glyoxylase-like metal-dependent hydrolase (beta-lactamase superfamily II) [Arthrobacter pigmenti]